MKKISIILAGVLIVAASAVIVVLTLLGHAPTVPELLGDKDLSAEDVAMLRVDDRISGNFTYETRQSGLIAEMMEYLSGLKLEEGANAYPGGWRDITLTLKTGGETLKLTLSGDDVVVGEVWWHVREGLWSEIEWERFLEKFEILEMEEP